MKPKPPKTKDYDVVPPRPPTLRAIQGGVARLAEKFGWEKISRTTNGEQCFALAYLAALDVSGEKGDRTL